MDLISDAELLAGIAAGSPDWTAVYARCRRPMTGTAIKVFGSADTERGGPSAEDIVQDVMAAAIKKGALPISLTNVTQLQNYLCVAVYRRALNAKTRKAGTLAELPEDIGLDDSLDDSFTVVDDALLAAQAAELVEVLPEAQKTVFREHVLKGRTQQEVADDLGVTDGMVRQHRTAGLRQLRSMLDVTVTQTTIGKEAKPK